MDQGDPDRQSVPNILQQIIYHHQHIQQHIHLTNRLPMIQPSNRIISQIDNQTENQTSNQSDPTKTGTVTDLILVVIARNLGREAGREIEIIALHARARIVMTVDRIDVMIDHTDPIANDHDLDPDPDPGHVLHIDQAGHQNCPNHRPSHHQPIN